MMLYKKCGSQFLKLSLIGFLNSLFLPGFFITLSFLSLMTVHFSNTEVKGSNSESSTVADHLSKKARNNYVYGSYFSDYFI